MSALASVREAVGDAPDNGLVKVRAADVIEVAKSVPSDRLTEQMRELAFGAEGAIRLANGNNALLVWQTAGQLRELIACAESVRQGA